MEVGQQPVGSLQILDIPLELPDWNDREKIESFI